MICDENKIFSKPISRVEVSRGLIKAGSYNYGRYSGARNCLTCIDLKKILYFVVYYMPLNGIGILEENISTRVEKCKGKRLLPTIFGVYKVYDC